MIKEVVRRLRKEQTAAENEFWNIVRNRKVLGKKFLRQHPILFDYKNQERMFIADFYCAEKRLIVEIDGGVHERQKNYDELRTFLLSQLGYRVIRFKNEEVNDRERVLSKLKKYLKLKNKSEIHGQSY